MSIQTLNNNVALLEQRTKINANFSELDTRTTTAQTTADNAATTAGAASTAAGLKYTKPGPGIPSSDMTTAVQSSLAKADSAVQPAGLTKAAVGLGNADNTSDADKPISTATDTALALKGDAPLFVPITATTTLSIAAHNGNILRLDASRTLEVPESLGTAFSCIVEMPIGATLAIDPTGAVILVDSATPAGSTTTRTRAHTANTSGVIIKSTGTANTLSVSGS
jgi:hypothetical protein